MSISRKELKTYDLFRDHPVMGEYQEIMVKMVTREHLERRERKDHRALLDFLYVLLILVVHLSLSLSLSLSLPPSLV